MLMSVYLQGGSKIMPSSEYQLVNSDIDAIARWKVKSHY